MKDHSSLSRPPLFDGSNYSHWKVKMRTYLQTLDYAVWELVQYRYSDVMNVQQCNAIGLNAIFMAMMNEKDFRRIRFCKTSKEAWDTLVKAYEWHKDDKETYLQLLECKLETMKMEEDERFDDFFIRFQELINTIKESSGNKYSAMEIKRKILRSLPPRFWSQRDTINLELLDLSKMSVDTLVVRLRTCEADWDQLENNLQRLEDKNKDLAIENSSHSKNSDGEAPYSRCLARYFSMLFRMQKEPY